MQQHVLLYINQGLKAQLRTFSPPVIIEDQHLQTFLHTLAYPKALQSNAHQPRADPAGTGSHLYNIRSAFPFAVVPCS